MPRPSKTAAAKCVERITSFDAATAAGCRRVISVGVIRAFLDISRPTLNRHLEAGVWGEPFTLFDGPTNERHVLFDKFKEWLDRRIANTSHEKNIAAAQAQSMLRRRP